MVKLKVYTAGAISGVPFKEANEWRRQVKALFRCKFIGDEAYIFNPLEAFPPEDFTDANEYYAMKADIRKLKASDVVICNISSNPKSIGTNMELAIAHEHDIPVYIYNPTGEKLHPWQILMSDKSFTTLEDLVDEIYRVFF